MLSFTKNNLILKSCENTINGDVDITVVLDFIKHINNWQNCNRIIQSSLELIGNSNFEKMTQLAGLISKLFSYFVISLYTFDLTMAASMDVNE